MYDNIAAGMSPPREMPRMAVGCQRLARMDSPSALMPSTWVVQEVARSGLIGEYGLVVSDDNSIGVFSDRVAGDHIFNSRRVSMRRWGTLVSRMNLRRRWWSSLAVSMLALMTSVC